MRYPFQIQPLALQSFYRMPDPDFKDEIDRFLVEQIETVPHLEALLLLWNNRPKIWPAEDMARALFLPRESARGILENLVRRRLALSTSPEKYSYNSEPDRDRLLAALDATYRHELIRITRMIHAKAPAAIREFARAFRLKKEGE